MKKPFKILVWVAGISLCLIIAAFVAFKIIFPVEKVRKMTVDLLSTHLHREVKLEGISLALGGVKIKGLEISELPDFSKGTMLKTDSVQVSFRVLPLLHKQFEIGRVSIDGLSASVRRDKNGLFNFSDLMAQPEAPAKQDAAPASAPAQTAPAAQPPSQPAAPSPLAELRISKISLTNASLSYKDDALGCSASIAGLDFQGREFALNKPFAFSVSLVADFTGMGVKASLPLSVDATVNPFDPAFPSSGLQVQKASISDAAVEYSQAGKMAVKIAKLQVKTANASPSAAFPLSVSLEADYSAMGTKARLPLTIEATVNPSARNFPYAGIEVKKVGVDGGAVEYSQDKKMAVKLTEVKLSAADASEAKAFPLAVSLNADYRSPEFSAKMPIALDASVNPGGGNAQNFSADIKALRLSYGKFALNATAKVSNGNAPMGSFTLKTQSVKASELQGLIPQLPQDAVLPEISAESDFSLDGTFTKFTLHNAKLQAGKTLHYSGKLLAVSQNGKWTARSAFQLAVPNLSEAADLLPVLKEYSPQGKAVVSGEVIYAPEALTYNLAASLTQAGGRFQNYVMKNLQGDLSLTEKSAQSKNLKGTVNQADFAAAFSAVYSMAQKTASVNANLDVGTVDLASFMPQPAGTAPVKQKAGQRAATASAQQGAAGSSAAGAAASAPVDFTINADINAKAKRLFYPNFEAGPTELSCNLKNLNPSALGRLNGTASFTVKGGAFQDLTKLAQGNAIAKIFLFPINVLQKASRIAKVQLLPDFDNVKYSAIEGRYRIANGVVNIEKSQMLSSAADIDSSGTLNLANEAIAMRITAKVPVAKTPIVIPMNVSGTMTAPKTSVNVVDLAKTEAAQGVVKEGVKAGAKLLQGLFK